MAEVTFNEEQQAMVDKLVGYARKETREKVTTEFSEETAGLRNQIETLTAELASAKEASEAMATKHAESEQIIKDLQSKVQTYETDSAKTAILYEMGLDFELKPLLNGETEDEIRKSAEILAKHTAKGTQLPLKSTEGGNNSDDYFERKYGSSPFYKKS